MSTISTTTMLVGIVFGLPRQSVKLEDLARNLETQNNAEAGVVSANGYYFKKRERNKKIDGLAALKKFQTSWGNDLKHFARYPFAAGFRLLPGPILNDFESVNNRYVREAEAVWNSWARNEYPQWRESAPERMGNLYNERDFPSLEDCRNRFICDVTVIPLAPIDQWQRITTISPDLAATMAQREEAAIQKVTQEYHAKLWADMMAPLKNVVEQLSKDKTKIHETLIGSLIQIADLIPAHNAVVQDAQLNALSDQVKATLGSITAEDLRKNAETKAMVLEHARRMVDEFEPYARSFELDEEEAPQPAETSTTETSTTERAE